jgi:hypothetical protein
MSDEFLEESNKPIYWRKLLHSKYKSRYHPNEVGAENQRQPI